jgi:hypothetical protein
MKSLAITTEPTRTEGARAAAASELARGMQDVVVASARIRAEASAAASTGHASEKSWTPQEIALATFWVAG